MKYMGSKNRIAKYILPIILKDRKPEQWYVEPMVGGANMIDKVEGNRIGADASKPLIQALGLIQSSAESLPRCASEYTREDYEKCKIKLDSDLSPLECFAMYTYSFSGKFKGGYAKGHPHEDFQRAARNNAIKQSADIQGVRFVDCTYQVLIPPPQSVIYCDPPYAKTTGYKHGDFNHDEFWQKCRDWCADGHQVFISEYNAPDDFVCVWEKEIAVNVAKNSKGKKGVERLFIHKSQL